MGLCGVDLRVADGGIHTVVGMPGCGKTTLLFCVGGLLNASGGRILLGERDVTELEPRERNVCLMREGQTPCRGTVEKNIEYGLRLRGVPPAERAARVREAAEVLGLSDLLRVKIGKLSELDRRRTSLARALARRPDVFLLDEPLFNLSESDRMALAADVVRAHEASGLTFLAASSAGEDAFLFGGDVTVMKDGCVVQTGSEKDLTESPDDRFVASYVGENPMSFVTTGQGIVGFRAEDTEACATGEFVGVAERRSNGVCYVRVSETEPPVAVRASANVGEEVRFTLRRRTLFDEDGNRRESDPR